MATNGLRYGAAIEIRQNFTGQISSSGSSGASGYASLETLYVRRAFTYVAGENWGIVRAGQADGLIGIFDNGVTTFQFLPTGNLNGGDLTNGPQNAPPTFVFLGQAGNEYANAKLVYLSPQIAGFDFGFQYAPNTSNGNGIGGSNNALNASITGSGTGTGLGCTIANSGCPSLSAGPGIQDGARALNQTAIGVRYQGAFGGLGVLAYGVYDDQPGCRLHRPEDAGGPRHHDNARQQVQRHLQRPELRQRRRRGDLCRVHRRWQRHRWQDKRPDGPAAVGRRANVGFPGRCEVRERPVDRGHRRRRVLGAGHGHLERPYPAKGARA